MSKTRRVGSPTEIHTVAARAVSSGDLHECPDGRTGVYSGLKDVAIGEAITLHTCEHLEVTAIAFAETTAGALANFNYATQTLVASGTKIGRYTAAKTSTALIATVLLNDPGVSA